MTRRPSARALKDLLADLIDSDDAVLYARAYYALGMLLRDDVDQTTRTN